MRKSELETMILEIKDDISRLRSDLVSLRRSSEQCSSVARWARSKAESLEVALCALASRTYGHGLEPCTVCGGVGWLDWGGQKYDCKTCAGSGCLPKTGVSDG